jgi:hypothetical protein
MKKVLADGTLGINEADTFVEPAGMALLPEIIGSVEEPKNTTEKKEEEYYFD